MRTYTQEEKQAVIDRFMAGEPSANILAETGIPKSTFYGWLRTYREKQEADFRNAVDQYIIFYNTRRPHKKLQYKTSAQ